MDISIEEVRKIVKIESTGRGQNEHRVERPCVTTLWYDQRNIRLVHANPKTTAREIKEPLQLNVGSEIIRTRLHEANWFERIASNKLYISEVNWRESWISSNNLLTIQKSLGTRFFEVRSHTFRKSRVWRQPHIVFDPKNVKGSVKSGYESVMVWNCFNYNGVGKLAFIHDIFKI